MASKGKLHQRRPSACKPCAGEHVKSLKACLRWCSSDEVDRRSRLTASPPRRKVVKWKVHSAAWRLLLLLGPAQVCSHHHAVLCGSLALQLFALGSATHC